MKAVVLAGGKGEGLYPVTQGVQKEAVEVCGKPIVMYSVSGLYDAGIREFIVVINERDDIINAIRESNVEADFEFVRQRQGGITGAINTGLDYVDDEYILVFGDIIAENSFYTSLLNAHQGGEPTFALVPVSRGLNTYGLAKVEGGKFVGLTERESTLALGGAYILRKEKFDDFSLYLRRAVGNYFVWSGLWFDIGYPEDLLRSIRGLLSDAKTTISRRAKVASTAIIDKGVFIDDGAVIDEYAVIRGPAYIGKNSYVGNFSLVRNFSCVERNSSIGAYVEISNSSIQEGVEIGSKSYINHSIIGKKARIGASVVTASYPATLIRGEENKLGALIAPLARVEHGKVLPPNSIISERES
ncbi:nucleotidyltransferase [Sulfolobales archaeon HS-7]|nr:nucleotidyltransferase [Sulfolobales archaeon HS-7]